VNQEQADFFESFGYVVIRQLFDTNDLAVLAREFHAGLDAQYPADRNDGAERLWTRLTDEDTPFAASLMEDRRLLGPAQRLCGPDVLGIGIDVNRYIGNTGWHPDTADENQVAVKFIFYLDAVDADTGALRVIPASHLLRGAERWGFAQPSTFAHGTLHMAAPTIAGPGTSTISPTQSRPSRSSRSSPWVQAMPAPSEPSNHGASITIREAGSTTRATVRSANAG